MSRAYLGFVIALLACTRSESREGATDQQVQRPLVMKSARDTVAWLSTTQLDLPHREKLIASPNGFATQPSLHTAHGLSRQGMTVELPARATGTTRLSSTLRQDVWMDVVADDLDIASTAESTGDALVFRGVRPVTDVVQLVGGDRFEELRVVHGAADSIEGRWKIHLGPGLADLVVVDGQIRARSADGYAWFQSYPLWVVDSAGTRRPASAQATSNGADATLVVRADAKGLVPPIALDPSFTSGGVLPGTVQAVGSVIKLASGKVLIAYGQPGTFVAYLYDPSTNTAVTAPGLTSITYSTWGVVGAALGDGRAAFSAEVYNGTTTTAFTPVDSEFDTPVAVGLPSGGVLVTGGRGSNTNNITEIVSGSPATAKKVADAPYYNYGVANGNAKGTLVGGKVAIYQPGSSYGIEVYTPTTDAWTSTLSPGSYRPTMMAVAALPGDHVLVAGGTAPSSGVATAYSYDIAAKSWAALPDMGTKRTGFEAVGFTNGALVIGGQMYDSATSTTTYHSSSEFYDVGSGTWSAGPSLANPRSNYLLGPIGAGKILVAGGRDSTSSLSSVEILNAAAPGTSCASATVCESGLTCVDATCCTTSTCPAGSKCSYALGKGTCRKDNGQTCTTAGECGTGFCVEGVCCDSACGATGTCKAAGKVGKCTKLEAQPCASSAECASNFCADGVCCDALCSGTCEACSAAKKGAGVDGKCGPIAADTDPDNECPTDSGFPASCKADGTCDGAGKCRAYAKLGTPCGATTCTGGSVSGKLCSGGGSCDTSSTPCAPYACGTMACKTMCTGDADCATGAFCSGGVCGTSKANGQPCASAKECGSGFCADGVCCNGACTGQCESCAEPANEGSCIPVTGSPRGTRPKCAGDPAACGGSCNGTKASECTYPPASKVCARTCTDGKETKSNCDGLGACVEGDRKSCAPFVCEDASKCRIDCTKDTDCIPSYKCAGNTCIATGGAKCSDDLSKSVGVDGKESSCGAFLCDPSTGLCKPICQTTTDCAGGNLCNPATKACEPAPQEDSGGCAIGGRASSLAAPFLAALLLGLYRRKRH